jgi:hypothetical protein
MVAIHSSLSIFQWSQLKTSARNLAASTQQRHQHPQIRPAEW